MRNLALSTLVIAFFAGPLLGAPLNNPLRPSQAACAERQLGRLQGRLVARSYPSFGGSNEGGASPLGYGRLAIWHSSLGGGLFSGLARIVDLGFGPFNDFQAKQEHFAEEDLAFDLIFKQGATQLDPEQARRPQATAVRRDSGTNLGVDHQGCYDYSQGGGGDLTCPAILTVDLFQQVGDPTHPLRAITINGAASAAPGLTGPGSLPLPTATDGGGAILGDQLAQSCGGALTDFDQRVFEILARTVVPSVCWVLLPFGATSVCLVVGSDYYGYNMTIFRGADPRTYRMNIYSYTNAICDDNNVCSYGIGGPVALDFHVEADPLGHLTTGTVQILPACERGQDVNCTNTLGFAGIFIVPPIFPGRFQEAPPAFQNAPYLSYFPTSQGPQPQNVLSATINWADLLKNTAWNSP